MSLESAFAKLAGREPSEERRQRSYRIRDALGIKNNDAFWNIVMALEPTIRSCAGTPPSSPNIPLTASRVLAQRSPLLPKTKPRTSRNCSQSESRKQAWRLPETLPRDPWDYTGSRRCSLQS